MKEYTYIMIKPDGVKQGLTEEIVRRIHSKGFEIKLFDVRKLDGDVIDKHYAHLLDKPFYPELETYMTSDNVMLMILERRNAVERFRKLMGPTDSRLAGADTIRGRYGIDKSTNAVHGSDSIENAIIEIERFFGKEIFKELDETSKKILRLEKKM